MKKILLALGLVTAIQAQAACYEVGRAVDQYGREIITTQCDPVYQGQPQIIPGQVVQQPSYNPQGELIAGAVIGTIAGALLANSFDHHDHYYGGYNRGYGGYGHYEHRHF